MTFVKVSYLNLAQAVADLGFSGGGWFGDDGEGAGGVSLPPEVRGLGHRENFCKYTSKICIFEAMFRQYLFISSLNILNKNVN
jgi:hypothetical protein